MDKTKIIKRKNKVIMKPTLKEVKEYFKDAEKIQCVFERYLVSEISVNDIEFKYGEYWAKTIDSEINLWDKNKGYAKILTYKTPKFEITKETILKYQMKDEFPEVFEKELEVCKWYWVKRTRFCDTFKALILYENKDRLFGFDHHGKYTSHYGNPKNDGYIITEATHEEVETALIGEAKKRGFVNGVFLKKSGINKQLSVKNPINGNFDYFESVNILDSQNGCGHIFDNGKWATIIETITIQEAEKLLNKKIVS